MPIYNASSGKVEIGGSLGLARQPSYSISGSSEWLCLKKARTLPKTMT